MNPVREEAHLSCLFFYGIEFLRVSLCVTREPRFLPGPGEGPMGHTRKAELNLFLPATDTQAIAFPTEMRTPLFLIVNLICEREKRKKNNKEAKETDEPEARVLGGSRASHGAASWGGGHGDPLHHSEAPGA